VPASYLDGPGELEATMQLERRPINASSNSSDSYYLAAAGEMKQNALILFAIVAVTLLF
jgi:hypothetical protein